jgi:hypothetical protein
MDLDSANRHGEDGRHLLIRQLLEVAQDQHHAIPGRQLLQLLAYDGLPVASLQGIFHLLLLVSLLQDLFRLYGSLQGSLTLAPLKLLQTAIVGDAIQPGRQARLASECWQPLSGSQKDFLGDLTGVFVVLQQAPTQIEDAALVPLHEDGKGVLVPLLTGLHELHIVLLSLPGNDTWESHLQVA